MRTRAPVSLIVLFATGLVTHAQVVPATLKPYSLPPETILALAGLAAQSDVLILGETHGTQEVPAVAAALLTPLAELGYGVLSLEIPADQQTPLTAWATGKTTKVPSFFAKPLEDGRGNIQVLSLIRTALSPPYNWRLICFDQSWENVTDEANGLDEKDRQPSTPLPGDLAPGMQRDAIMALILANERARLAPHSKVLAICGNIHARTANRAPAGSPVHQLWPSFAAALLGSHSKWNVQSVNVVPRSGAFFAMTAAEGEPPRGKVNTIRTTRQLDEAEAHPLHHASWNWELNLPRATPATFLVPPSNADR